MGIAKNARYLTFDLDKPIPPLFFLPEPQHDLDPKTGSPEIDSSHFLSDIIIVTSQALASPKRKYAGDCCGRSQPARYLGSQSQRASSWSV